LHKPNTDIDDSTKAKVLKNKGIYSDNQKDEARFLYKYALPLTILLMDKRSPL
tara:strand:+ start:8426 stop:8584 length:159 start_codon:yes stop_codon:yes gene_type:complete